MTSLLHYNNKQVLFSPYYLTMFSYSFLFLYYTVPFSTDNTAHATVVRLNHECTPYTAEAETEKTDGRGITLCTTEELCLRGSATIRLVPR